jgi:hypothetical protein
VQVRCIKARLGVKVGDLAEVPDGAAVSPLYYEPVAEASPPPAGPPGPPASPPPPSSAPASEGTA